LITIVTSIVNIYDERKDSAMLKKIIENNIDATHTHIIRFLKIVKYIISEYSSDEKAKVSFLNIISEPSTEPRHLIETNSENGMCWEIFKSPDETILISLILFFNEQSDSSGIPIKQIWMRFENEQDLARCITEGKYEAALIYNQTAWKYDLLGYEEKELQSIIRQINKKPLL
jgi:hypothetical protein